MFLQNKQSFFEPLVWTMPSDYSQITATPENQINSGNHQKCTQGIMFDKFPENKFNCLAWMLQRNKSEKNSRGVGKYIISTSLHNINWENKPRPIGTKGQLQLG